MLFGRGSPGHVRWAGASATVRRWFAAVPWCERGMTTSDETFRLLYEVAVATSGVLEPERLAALPAARAGRLTGADSSLLFWWVPERELLVLQATDPLGTAAIGCTRR